MARQTTSLNQGTRTNKFREAHSKEKTSRKTGTIRRDTLARTAKIRYNADIQRDTRYNANIQRDTLAITKNLRGALAPTPTSSKTHSLKRCHPARHTRDNADNQRDTLAIKLTTSETHSLKRKNQRDTLAKTV